MPSRPSPSTPSLERGPGWLEEPRRAWRFLLSQAQRAWATNLGEKPLCTCTFAKNKGFRHGQASRPYGGPGKKPMGGHEPGCEHDILLKSKPKGESSRRRKK